ncbi:MAG: transposase [Candidatus Berkiella sp.]
MSDWLKRISSIITERSEEAASAAKDRGFTPLQAQSDFQSLSLFTPSTTRHDPTFKHRAPTARVQPPTTLVTVQDEEKTMAKPQSEDDDNLKALKRLRDLPRGTQVDSRIAAIDSLLGEKEVFKTLKMLRWPQGVTCPRCHSSNIVRRDPPPDASDQRHFYVCLNCKGDGSPSDFDDFTGLPIGSIHALRQWILCWYLIGFCSVHQIAKVLGLSVQQVMQIASVGSEVTSLPEAEAKQKQRAKELFSQKERQTKEHKRARDNIELEEEYRRSASRSPLKPGSKSKK